MFEGCSSLITIPDIISSWKLNIWKMNLHFLNGSDNFSNQTSYSIKILSNENNLKSENFSKNSYNFSGENNLKDNSNTFNYNFQADINNKNEKELNDFYEHFYDV